MAKKTITIFSKKAFRFPNPDPRVALVSKPAGDERPEEAVHRVSEDSSRLGASKRKELPFFDTKPGEIQEAPAWIKEDAMFDWAVADGDLLEVTSKSPVKQQAEVAEATADDEEETGEEDEVEMGGAVPPGARRKKVVKAS